MPEQGNIKNNPKAGIRNKISIPFSIFNRPLLFSLMVFLVLTLLFTLLILQRYQLAKESREKEAFEVVLQAKDRLQVALTHSFAAAKMLALLIDKNGEMNNFDSAAAQVLETGSSIDAVQLVPNGVIKYIYPLKGNEKAIGYNILQDSTRNKEAYKAIEQKTMYFGGPFELRQGGIGVVGRLPVYRQNKFWGFSAAVIKMETLYRVAGIDSSGKNGYYFQLSKINPDTKEEEFFMPQHKELSHNHQVSVQVPNGEWKLSVYSAVHRRVSGDIGLLAVLGFLLSVLGSLFAYRFALRPKKLKELVQNRTFELNASENNYRSVIERVSDAFVALDNNWLYTYVNEKAGEILGRDPQSLIGKNIWTEFPLGVDQPFYHAYHRAMETQEYQYLDEYYAPFDKWLENHIYPSKDGLTIFFKDVTNIKQITQALKNKEEKYRTLIEQASDGIVITDMEGVILEVNKSIQQMIGYADDEMIGYNITEFLPQEDLESNPLRISELMQGKNLLYERRLKKKDGTLLDVEVNSKMASSHTLIAFIRDITERKEVEAALKKSNERFELIASATNDAIWDHDYEKNETWGNNQLYKIHGLEPASRKITFEMFLNRINPDERDGIEQRMEAAIKNKVSSLSEIFRFKTEDEGYRIFYDRAYIKYSDAGNPLRILGAMQDITEREYAQKALAESEEKYRTIIEQAAEGIFIADENTYLVDVNSAGCRMGGYSLDELKKLKFQDFIPPEDLAHNPMQIDKLERGESATNERRLICKDGTVIDVEISAQKLLDGHYQLFVRDIRERKKAEELLQKSYNDIRQLASNLQSIREDERTTIAREIHDELGQQLTGLKMDIYWLSRKINTADDEIAAKLTQSMDLINATVASVRKIATNLRPSILDDLGLIAALEWQGEEFEKRSGTRVEFMNEAGDITLNPDVVTGIFRIYQELLTNVARHANASLVKVLLQKKADIIYFKLTDNGSGFDPELISKKKTLGLLGIKERTLLLGGTYEFKSRPGEGSETIITIPINK